MGLFDYLLIVGMKEKMAENEIEKFFLENQYTIVEKKVHWISLIQENIEVLITNDREFSIRTKLQNDASVLDSMIEIIKLFSETMKREIAVYDYQFKKVYNTSNLHEITKCYLERQESLREYFY